MAELSREQLQAMPREQRISYLNRMTAEQLARLRGTSIKQPSRPNPFSVMDHLKGAGRVIRQAGTAFADEAAFGVPEMVSGGSFVPEAQTTGQALAEFGGRTAGFLVGGPAKLAGKVGAKLGGRMASKFLANRAGGMVAKALPKAIEGAASFGSTGVAPGVTKAIETGDLSQVVKEPAGRAATGAVLAQAGWARAKGKPKVMGGKGMSIETTGALEKARGVPHTFMKKKSSEMFEGAVKEADEMGKTIKLDSTLKNLRRLYTKKPKGDSLEATKALDEKLIAYEQKFGKNLRQLIEDKSLSELKPSEVQHLANMLSRGRSTQALQEINKTLRSNVYDSLTESGKKTYGKYKTGAQIRAFFKDKPKEFATRMARKWLVGDPISK